MSAVYVKPNETAFTFNPSRDGCTTTSINGGATEVWTCGAPRSATLKFTGTAVFYLPPGIPSDYSPMLIGLDHNPVSVVFPPNNTSPGAPVWFMQDLENTEHTLTVESAFEGGSFYVDTVVFISEPLVDGVSSTFTTTTATTATTITVTPSLSQTSSQPTSTLVSTPTALLATSLTSESSATSDVSTVIPESVSPSSHHSEIMIGLGVVAGFLALILVGILTFWLKRRQAHHKARKLHDAEARAVIDPLPPPPPAGGYMDSLVASTPFTVVTTIPSIPADNLVQGRSHTQYNSSNVMLAHSRSTSASSTPNGRTASVIRLGPPGHIHTLSPSPSVDFSSTASYKYSKLSPFTSSDNLMLSSSEALLNCDDTGMTPPPRYTLSNVTEDLRTKL